VLEASWLCLIYRGLAHLGGSAQRADQALRGSRCAEVVVQTDDPPATIEVSGGRVWRPFWHRTDQLGQRCVGSRKGGSYAIEKHLPTPRLITAGWVHVRGDSALGLDAQRTLVSDYSTVADWTTRNEQHKLFRPPKTRAGAKGGKDRRAAAAGGRSCGTCKSDKKEQGLAGLAPPHASCGHTMVSRHEFVLGSWEATQKSSNLWQRSQRRQGIALIRQAGPRQKGGDLWQRSYSPLWLLSLSRLVHSPSQVQETIGLARLRWPRFRCCTRTVFFANCQRQWS